MFFTCLFLCFRQQHDFQHEEQDILAGVRRHHRDQRSEAGGDGSQGGLHYPGLRLSSEGRENSTSIIILVYQIIFTLLSYVYSLKNILPWAILSSQLAIS